MTPQAILKTSSHLAFLSFMYLTISNANASNAVEIEVATDQTLTIQNEHTFTLPENGVLIKSGRGKLIILANQGQDHSHGALNQGPLAGKIQLTKGEICIHTNESLGNGYYWNGAAPAETNNNCLEMSSETTLSISANVSLQVPIVIDNSTSGNYININCDNHTLSLKGFSQTGVDETQVIVNFNNDNLSAKLTEITLTGVYTPSSNDDAMYVDDYVQINGSNTNNFAPNIHMSNHSTIAALDNLVFTKIQSRPS